MISGSGLVISTSPELRFHRTRIFNSIDFNIDNMKTINGIRHNNYIESDGTEGFLIYGPYIPLKRGKYIAELNIEILENLSNDDNLFTFDIVYDYGKVITSKVFKDNNLIKEINKIQLPFELKNDIKNLELRLYTNKGIIIKILNIKLQE